MFMIKVAGQYDLFETDIGLNKEMIDKYIDESRRATRAMFAQINSLKRDVENLTIQLELLDDDYRRDHAESEAV